MERLKACDFVVISKMLPRLYAFRDLQSFVRLLLLEIPRLIDSDVTVYGELNPSARRFRFESEPADAHFPGWQAVYRAHLPEHPFAKSYQGGGGGTPVKLSDVMTDAQFRDAGLYKSFFRRLGVDREMVVWLPAPRPLELTLAVHRVRRDFSERDRTVLNLLRTHIAQAYRNAEAATLVRKFSRTTGHGLVLLTASGRMAEPDEAKRTLLAKYFGARRRSDGLLPDDLARWVRYEQAILRTSPDAPPAREPLRIERDGTTLTVRLFSGPTQSALLFEERGVDRDVRSLDHLGLTCRESEVLSWVAEGKSNEDIAAVLGISARTVAKHLERMYPKLGVENRTAAAARAHEANSRLN